MQAKLLTFNGKTMTVPQWSEELGISKNTIWTRIWNGRPIHEVLCGIKKKNYKYPTELKPGTPEYRKFAKEFNDRKEFKIAFDNKNKVTEAHRKTMFTSGYDEGECFAVVENEGLII